MTKAQFLAALRAHFGLAESVNVADSNEALKDDLNRALNQWAARPSHEMEILYVFGDRLIAYVWQPEGNSPAWEIPWASADGAFTFGEPTPVERVVRYEPMAESAGQGKEQRMDESVEQTLTLAEGAGAVRRVRAVGVTADVVNANKRRYARGVLANALAELNSHLHESAGQGRLKVLTGEAEHPTQRNGQVNILETVVKWEAASLDTSGQVILEGVILPTAKGKDVQVLVENGIPIGVSQRGYGVSKLIEEDGQTIEEVQKLRITGYDLVAQPSDPNGWLLESQDPTTQEDVSMTLKELLELLAKQPELQESLVQRFSKEEKAKFAESLGIKDPSKLEEAVQTALEAQKTLAEQERQKAIDAAITEATKGLKYGDGVNAAFVESVRAAAPATAEAVKAIVESKRKEYDAILSKGKLDGMGHKPQGRTIEVVGSAFEEGTGYPEFARASFAVAERLAERGLGKIRDFSEAKTPSDLYAKRYLEAYDKAFKPQLIAEAARFQAMQEAEQVSDLNLPYSVQRAVIAEVHPELVASSVFDFGFGDASPMYLYYENYNGETGAQPTVTDESVTSDEGAWVSLANARLQPGTVVVTSDPAGTTYTDGTDYVIDYGNGRLWTLASGSIGDATDLLVDYTYDAVRKGEMQAIQRGKGTLSRLSIEFAADRLAQQISDEAVTFAASQMGWDATTRTLNMLIREIREMIDTGAIRLALAMAQISGQSGGTWTSATDTLTELIEKMGVAKVAVQNANYEPNSFLMTLTNADRIENWLIGTNGTLAANIAANRGTLGAGDTGIRIKGLPVFASKLASDGLITVQHRELVQHRVFTAKPMTLKGPYPSYDSNGKLIAADQHYVEEYNATESLIAAKGGFVKVA